MQPINTIKSIKLSWKISKIIYSMRWRILSNQKINISILILMMSSSIFCTWFLRKRIKTGRFCNIASLANSQDHRWQKKYSILLEHQPVKRYLFSLKDICSTKRKLIGNLFDKFCFYLWKIQMQNTFSKRTSNKQYINCSQLNWSELFRITNISLASTCTTSHSKTIWARKKHWNAKLSSKRTSKYTHRWSLQPKKIIGFWNKSSTNFWKFKIKNTVLVKSS